MIHDDAAMFPCPPMDPKLRGPKEEPKYHVKIIRRDFQGQTADDYHATVTRISDGVKLVFISGFRPWLEWKVRRPALDRAFANYDRHQKKLAEVKEVMK